MKNILLLICILISFQNFAQTSLTGKVTDEETGEPILFGSVALFKGGSLETGVETDLDGFYNFSNIDPGTYDVEVTYVGYSPTRVTDVTIYGGQVNKLDIQLGQGLNLEVVVIPDCRIPLVSPEDPPTHTLEELRKLPITNLTALISSLPPHVDLEKSVSIKPNLPKKLPSRTINNTVQNMLDLQIKKIDYGK